MRKVLPASVVLCISILIAPYFTPSVFAQPAPIASGPLVGPLGGPCAGCMAIVTFDDNPAFGGNISATQFQGTFQYTNGQSASFFPCDTIPITANPAPGAKFLSWSVSSDGAVSNGSSASTTLILLKCTRSSVTITANYAAVQLMHIYVMNNDHSITKVVTYQPRNAPSKAQSTLSGFSNQTFTSKGESVFISQGIINGTKTTIMSYKETHTSYNVTVSDRLVYNATRAVWSSDVVANLQPTKGNNLNIGDAFALNYSSPWTDQVTGMENGLSIVGTQYQSSTNSTIQTLGGYYLHISAAFVNLSNLVVSNTNLGSLTVGATAASTVNDICVIDCFLICSVVVVVIVLAVCAFFTAGFCLFFAPEIIAAIEVVCGVVCFLICGV